MINAPSSGGKTNSATPKSLWCAAMNFQIFMMGSIAFAANASMAGIGLEDFNVERVSARIQRVPRNASFRKEQRRHLCSHAIH
jgi:hypothetical protein